MRVEIASPYAIRLCADSEADQALLQLWKGLTAFNAGCSVKVGSQLHYQWIRVEFLESEASSD